MGVLGQAHRPAHDRAAGRGHHLATRVSWAAGTPVAASTVPISTERAAATLPSKPEQFCAMKSRSTTVRGPVVGLQEQPRHAEQGHVAAEADLDEFVGDRHAASGHPADRLRVVEADESASGSGLTAMIRAIGLRLPEHRQHPGMIGARFCPAITMRSAAATSSTVTDPLPTPIDSVNAVPEDS